MATNTAIQWTDVTWNIARGCDKVDADCKYCYMYRDSLGGTRYIPNTVTRTKTVFNLPLRLKQPAKIFTCSLTDFFHDGIDSYRHEAWDIIRQCPQHTFQILTKRPERIKDHLPPDWGEGWNNVWLGTSVGSQASINRMVELSMVDCKTRFLSLEPLHGEINLKEAYLYLTLGNKRQRVGFHALPAYDWVIVGGESGNDNGKYRYRPCKLEWIEEILYQCKHNHIPVFVKQLGTHLAKELKLTDRHGGNMAEWPEHLRVREFPKQKQG